MGARTAGPTGRILYSDRALREVFQVDDANGAFGEFHRRIDFHMNESTRKRVLEKFFSTKTTGKGLGLATVLGVVRRHKGAILVENKPNLGSRFVVLFPTAGRLSEQPSVGRNHQHWRGSGLILLVDDETMVIRVMKRMVELTGFSVLTATSEEEAIQTFSVHADEISAVILDFNMPGMDGKTTLAEDP